MLSERKFIIVKITAGYGTGVEPVAKYNQVVNYTGKEVTVKL